MKFALVNGERKEPAPGLIGSCSGCSQPTLAKCGKIKVHHWAHKSKLECDPWWENETEWHRNWKMLFPESWQEVVHRAADTGEFHRADVKTDKHWVLEFQYSAIDPVERISRNDFYGQLVWIVTGQRRKREPLQFFQALKLVKPIEDPVFKKAYDVVSERSALLRDWSNDKTPVFFDFEQPETLWCLLPRSSGGKLIVAEISRKAFVALHLANSASPNDIFGELIQFVAPATSAEDLFLKFHYRRRDEERQKQIAAEEAWRRNPYRNQRSGFRF